MNEANLNILEENNHTLKLSIDGLLNFQTITPIWQECIEKQKTLRPKHLIIDAKNLSFCDSAGMALLIALQQHQIQNNAEFQIKDLAIPFRKMFDRLCQSGKIESEAKKKKIKLRLARELGHFTVSIADNIKTNIYFIGAVCFYLLKIFIHPSVLRFKDFIKCLQDVGPNALPLTALLGFLIGLISAFQAAIPLEQFGAQIYIGSLVSVSLVREMGPLMTAIIIAGRTSSSFAAELGTMKINQEIDALSTMGLDPIHFLTLPRILATTLMAPLLCVFLVFFGIIGCGIVMHTLGFNMDVYLQQPQKFITIQACIGSLIKTVVFGLVISGIGCLHGLKTELGPSTVGYATTRAVVSGIIMIVFIDGIFASVFYALGI